MLYTSFIPKSTTEPIVPHSILIPLFLFDKYALAPPVAVKVVVFLLGPPYSTGYLNCFSAELLWEDVEQIQFFIIFLSTYVYAIIKLSTLVAHAL